MMDIEKLGIQIAWNTRLQGLIYVKDPLKSYHRYTITQIIKDFRVYNASFGFINNFYVYLKNTNIVLSPTSKYDSFLAYTVFHQNDEVTYEEWMKLVNGKYNKTYMLLKKINDQETTNNTIMYLQSLPIEDVNQSIATIVILIDKSLFSEAVLNIQWPNRGVAVIIDKNSNIVSATKPFDSIPYLNYDNLSELNNLIYDDLNKQDIFVYNTVSKVTGWKYVSIVPKDVVMNKTRYIKKLTLISVIACFLFGASPLIILLRKTITIFRILFSRLLLVLVLRLIRAIMNIILLKNQ